jgi:hypothetical protein
MPARLSVNVRNSLLAGGLGLFCAGVWGYTMRAVGGGGKDELEAAIAKQEAKVKK